MRFLSEQSLVDFIRKSADQIQKRLWIASPYIGHWKSVRQILGRKWFDQPYTSVRTILDIRNDGWIDATTYERLKTRGDVKTLPGLHAKIFIIDDTVILGSANLTETAFSSRYEANVILNGKESRPVISAFNRWWDIASVINTDWRPKACDRNHGNDGNEPNDPGLMTLWDMPPDPGDLEGSQKQIAKIFLDYDEFMVHYQDFAKRFERVGRLWPNSPLYLETDSFLDFLFHHGKKPSLPYAKMKKKVIPLSSQERNAKISNLMGIYREYIEQHENPKWREQYSRKIRTILNEDNIGNIDRDDIKNVIGHLNCMNSLPLNAVRFLRPRNNSLDAIRKAWRILLYGNGPIAGRMLDCSRMLRFFGKSSTQELIGFFAPREFPLRNTNVNAGLRFFGYPVNVY